MKSSALCLILLASLLACSQPGPTIMEGKGALKITITGLPANTNAAIQIAGVNDYSNTLEKETLLNNLEPGIYAVTATPVSNGTENYLATVTGSPATVEEKKTAEVTVNYLADTNNNTCAFTLSEDINLSTALVNTPTSCDYLIAPEPGNSGLRTLRVTNGQLLIEPGTVIRFADNAGIRINDNASLYAVGTPSARIRFEGAAPIRGYGRGIFLGTDSLASTIEYADFAYLGQKSIGAFTSWNGAISGLQGGGLSLKNTTVQGSIYHGVELDDLPLLDFANNSFSDNALYSVKIDPAQVYKLDKGSDYLGDPKNGRPYVLIAGADDVFESGIWQALNVPYFIEVSANIRAGTITVEPGSTFVFDEGADLDIKDTGALKAIGTPDAPIIFTGEQAVAGYWEGLSYFESPSRDNILDYAEVSFAGGSNIIEGAVSVGLESYLKMSNTLVKDSASWGVCVTFISNSNAATFEQGSGNVFKNNPFGDVVIDCDD